MSSHFREMTNFSWLIGFGSRIVLALPLISVRWLLGVELFLFPCPYVFKHRGVPGGVNGGYEQDPGLGQESPRIEEL
jgi:hypothetical protein